MHSIALWVSTHPADFAIIAGAVVSLTSSIAKYVITPDFEERNPKTSKVIRIAAKLSADIFGAFVEAKKKPAPPSDQTMIVIPEDSKP